MAAPPHFTVRQMRPDEIPAVLDLWREVELSEGTFSLHTFYEYDPEGFFVAVSDDGTVLGSCAGVKQNEELYFIGLYAVKAEFRGRGIGLQVWRAVAARIGDERNVGVNPVPRQLANYRDRSGLRVQADWVTYVAEAPSLDAALFRPCPPGVELKTLGGDDDGDLLERVAAYDALVYGFGRGALVRLSCTQRECTTVVALRGGGEVCGFGSAKADIRTRDRALVGPLYADGAEVAEALLGRLVAGWPGATLMLIDKNREAVEMAARIGFRFGEPIGRLYKKAEVHVDYQKVFGQHNLNFSLF